MTDPTPNGQTWRCGRTDPHTPHASYADHEKVCPGIPRPVPPAPSQRDPELAAALNEQRRQSYNAETLRTRPAPRSDTPSDERLCGHCAASNDPSPAHRYYIVGRVAHQCPGRPAPSPVPEASGRPGEMVFTQGSPRPALQVLVSLTDGRPCVDAVSMLAFFRDSAAWNEVAGDPEKVAGLRAAADAMWELHGKAKAHLHASAPSSSPVGDRGLELAGWLATCAADTLAYIEAGHRISHAEPVGDRCLTDCTEAWYVERDTLRAAIADVRALLAAADRGEPTP